MFLGLSLLFSYVIEAFFYAIFFWPLVGIQWCLKIGIKRAGFSWYWMLFCSICGQLCEAIIIAEFLRHQFANPEVWVLPLMLYAMFFFVSLMAFEALLERFAVTEDAPNLFWSIRLSVRRGSPFHPKKIRQ